MVFDLGPPSMSSVELNWIAQRELQHGDPERDPLRHAAIAVSTWSESKVGRPRPTESLTNPEAFKVAALRLIMGGALSPVRLDVLLTFPCA